MPLDMAQFLRNSISIDRYEAMQSASQTASAAEAPAETGSLMGTTFVVESDPTAELMDSMEELTFMFEEKESKSISERKLGIISQKGNIYLKALENWMKTLPDMPDQKFTERLLAMFRQSRSSGETLSVKDLLARLQEGSKEPVHQFAMLDVLEQALSGSESQLKELITASREALLAEHGEAIRAGINLASEINAKASTPEEMQILRDMYKGEVLGFTTPQNCFKSIMSSRGASGLTAAMEFLVKGCGADIQSANPSKSPEELRRILLDLQCVQVLHTVLDKMEALNARLEKQFNEKCLLNGQEMTGKIVDFTEHPFVTSGDIARFISSCGIEMLLARMDFCRELTDIFRRLSSRMFESEEDRFRLVDAAQEHLDGIISEEYENDGHDSKEDEP